MSVHPDRRATHVVAPADEALASQVRALPLPIGLIDLQTRTIVAVSDHALQFTPLRVRDILGQPVLERIGPESRAGAADTLEAMASGTIDLFRVWPLALSSDPSRRVITWVRRIDVGDHRYALYQLADADLELGSPLSAYLGREPFQLAVGSLDESGKVVWISNSITKILGVEPQTLVGSERISRVQRDDVERVLAATRSVAGGHAVGLGIRLRTGHGHWRAAHLIVASLHGPRPLRLFILTPDPAQAELSAARIADLEYHLWKIAAEVEAAGIASRVGALPVTSLPEHDALTPRQWEVLSRLLNGERVPTIADELFLSQSTVRGHVGAVMKRFGVRSQPELLKLLRGGAAS